jgi:hypothetical protein
MRPPAASRETVYSYLRDPGDASGSAIAGAGS